MVRIAVLHGTLPQLLSRSPASRAAGLDVVRSAADLQEFRSGLACQRIDALVLNLALLGSDPLREIDRLRKYTRVRAAVVTHGFVDGQTLRDVQDRVDLVVVREPLTPTRLRGLLARVLDEPELATSPPVAADSAEHPARQDFFDELVGQPAPSRRFDDMQLHQAFEEAIAGNYEFTQYISELLIHLAGFEDYCRRRNAGREGRRGLHTDVERGVAHTRAVLEEALHRLAAATGLDLDGYARGGEQRPDNVHDLTRHRGP